MSSKLVFYTIIVSMLITSVFTLNSIIGNGSKQKAAPQLDSKSSLSDKVTSGNLIVRKTYIEPAKSADPVNDQAELSEITQDSTSHHQEPQQSNEIDSENFVAELIDVIGDGGVLPITDKETQNRLLNKIRSDKHKRILDDYNKAEYDPSYDSTWSNDIQNTAVNELDTYFPETAYIESYECASNSICNLKLAGLGSDKMFAQEASEFMYALRDTPAIIKSGATRDVFLSSIRFDENGKSLVELIIAENQAIEGLNTPSNNSTQDL